MPASHSRDTHLSILYEAKGITHEMGREFSLHYSVKRLGQYRRNFQAIAIESQFSEVVLSLYVMQYGWCPMKDEVYG